MDACDISVFVNGSKIKWPLFVNTLENFVIACCEDDSGGIKLEGGFVCKEKIVGNVEVIGDNMQELAIKVDTSNVESATKALNAFSEAAERAEKAIASLNGVAHGGASFQMVGDVAKLEVFLHFDEAIITKTESELSILKKWDEFGIPIRTRG